MREHASSLAQVIQQAIDARLRDMHTAMPGIVVAFDAATQLLDVQPAIRRIMRTTDGENETLTPVDVPRLINVPLVSPRAGGFAVTVPVKPGDEVLLIFAERSIDDWHTTGETSTPTRWRMHDYSDAFAIAGIGSKPKPIPDYSTDTLQIKDFTGTTVIDVAADSLTLTSQEIALESATIALEGGASYELTAPTITLTGAVTVNGTLTVAGAATMQAGLSVNGTATNDGVNIGKTHTHAQGSDSDGNSQQDTGPPK